MNGLFKVPTRLPSACAVIFVLNLSAGCEKSNGSGAATAVATPAPVALGEAKPAPVAQSGKSTQAQPPAAVDPVAAALPVILKQIQSLDFPAAYVALTALDQKVPGHPEVKKLLAELRVVLAEITPRPPAAKSPGARKPQRFAEVPIVEQTQFSMFVKQAQSKHDLPALMKSVKAFCLKNPNVAGGWLLQGQLALALQRPIEGTFASENLMALGALDSRDPAVITTLAALESAGWLKPKP